MLRLWHSGRTRPIFHLTNGGAVPGHAQFQPHRHRRGDGYARPGARLHVRHPGARAVAAAAEGAGPAGRAEHGRVHLRLPGLAARRSRPGAVEGEGPARGERHHASSRGSTRSSPRPPSGAPSRSTCSRARGSTACSASGTARGRASIAASTCSSTPTPPAPRRMAACWRSPATTMARNPRPCRIRASRARGRHDPGAQPVGRAGVPRFRPARLGDVALLRLLGRDARDRGHGRDVLARDRRSAPDRDAHADRLPAAAGRREHPLAGPAAGAGTPPARYKVYAAMEYARPTGSTAS